MEYFVVDTRINEIVNVIMTSGVPSLNSFADVEFLRLDTDPPLEMLQRYRYWAERP